MLPVSRADISFINYIRYIILGIYSTIQLNNSLSLSLSLSPFESHVRHIIKQLKYPLLIAISPQKTSSSKIGKEQQFQ